MENRQSNLRSTGPSRKEGTRVLLKDPLQRQREWLAQGCPNKTGDQGGPQPYGRRRR